MHEAGGRPARSDPRTPATRPHSAPTRASRTPTPHTHTAHVSSSGAGARGGRGGEWWGDVLEEDVVEDGGLGAGRGTRTSAPAPSNMAALHRPHRTLEGRTRPPRHTRALRRPTCRPPCTTRGGTADTPRTTSHCYTCPGGQGCWASYPRHRRLVLRRAGRAG